MAPQPEVAPESLCVLEVDGRVAGYGDIWIDNGKVALEVAAPGHWQTFLQWAEESARAAGALRSRVQTYSAQELAAAATARDYRLWRTAYTMQIHLEEASPDVPTLPSGIEVRTYRQDDVDLLRGALDDAFAADPFFHEATLSNFREFYLGARGFDPALWLLA